MASDRCDPLAVAEGCAFLCLCLSVGVQGGGRGLVSGCRKWQNVIAFKHTNRSLCHKEAVQMFNRMLVLRNHQRIIVLKSHRPHLQICSMREKCQQTCRLFSAHFCLFVPFACSCIVVFQSVVCIYVFIKSTKCGFPLRDVDRMCCCYIYLSQKQLV